MREIKFRVWIKPEYWNETENKGLMTNGLPLNGFDKWWLNLDDPFSENYSLDGEFTVGKEIEIMQFTGLKDKNGNEIYEGDLIKVQDPYNSIWSVDSAEVVFSNKYVGGWVISNGNQNLNLGTRQKYLKVVGNKYENPELVSVSNAT